MRTSHVARSRLMEGRSEPLELGLEKKRPAGRQRVSNFALISTMCNTEVRFKSLCRQEIYRLSSPPYKFQISSHLSSPALGVFKHLSASIAPSLYILPPLSLIIF